MEYWLKEEGGSTFRFPVVPSSFDSDLKTSITSVQANAIGEIGMFSGLNLASYSFSSFFPNQQYSFVDYRNFPSPYECVKIIRKWMENGTVVRFIVTDTDINFEVIIEDFSYKEQDGTRDVYFDIKFKEYRRIVINKQVIQTTPAKPEDSKPRPEPETTTPTQRTYTVVKGDCLWNIAKKYYGSGSSYTKIYNANKDKIKDPNRIYPGQVLIIP